LKSVSIVSPEKIAEVLKLDQEIHEIALKIHNQKSLLMMGRGYQFATCLEGALVRPLLYLHKSRLHNPNIKTIDFAAENSSQVDTSFKGINFADFAKFQNHAHPRN